MTRISYPFYAKLTTIVCLRQSQVEMLSYGHSLGPQVRKRLMNRSEPHGDWHHQTAIFWTEYRGKWGFEMFPG